MSPAAVQQELPDAAELDRAVREVLERPEFAREELPALLQWMIDVYTAAREALWRAILELGALREAAPVLYWVVVAWLVVSLVAILVHLGVTAVRAWRARGRSGDEAAAPEASVEREAPAPSAWEARAREHAEAGRPRDAAVALYRAVVLRLDERDVLSWDPSKTPGDYRRETAGATATGGALHRFLRRFEPVAFGGRAVSSSDWTGLLSAAREAGARV